MDEITSTLSPTPERSDAAGTDAPTGPAVGSAPEATSGTTNIAGSVVAKVAGIAVADLHSAGEGDADNQRT